MYLHETPAPGFGLTWCGRRFVCVSGDSAPAWRVDCVSCRATFVDPMERNLANVAMQCDACTESGAAPSPSVIRHVEKERAMTMRAMARLNRVEAMTKIRDAIRKNKNARHWSGFGPVPFGWAGYDLAPILNLDARDDRLVINGLILGYVSEGILKLVDGADSSRRKRKFVRVV
jgi:hypothetical protein